MRKILERLGIIKPSDQSSEKTSFGTFLKNAFTKNLGAKLLCLFGAIFLWFYVMDNESSIYEYTFKNIDELLCLCSDESVDEFVIQEREYLAIINRFISDMLVNNRGAYNYIFTGVKKPTLPELGKTINSMKVLKQKRRLYTQKI